MRKPYHKIILAYVRTVFGCIGYFIAYGTKKGHKLRIGDCVNFNEVSEIREKYDDKRVMNTVAESLKADY